MGGQRGALGRGQRRTYKLQKMEMLTGIKRGTVPCTIRYEIKKRVKYVLFPYGGVVVKALGY